MFIFLIKYISINFYEVVYILWLKVYTTDIGTQTETKFDNT